MQFLSLEPFVPSGPDFEGSKKLFVELGFEARWDAGDYVGFEKDGCGFILQKFADTKFAENFMLSVKVSDIEEFLDIVKEKKLEQIFGIKIGSITQQPYGRELNIIDLAGVCWHFIQ